VDGFGETFRPLAKMPAVAVSETAGGVLVAARRSAETNI